MKKKSSPASSLGGVQRGLEAVGRAAEVAADGGDGRGGRGWPGLGKEGTGRWRAAADSGGCEGEGRGEGTASSRGGDQGGDKELDEGGREARGCAAAAAERAGSGRGRRGAAM